MDFVKPIVVVLRNSHTSAQTRANFRINLLIFGLVCGIMACEHKITKLEEEVKELKSKKGE